VYDGTIYHEGHRQKATGYSKRYHYSSSQEKRQPGMNYGRIYDSISKKYEPSPSKISYEIKLYIPKHETGVATKPEYGSPYEETPEYAPYDERSLYSSAGVVGPKYEQKMTYMKPYYTSDGRTMYDTKPAYGDAKVTQMYPAEKRPMVLYQSPTMDYEQPTYRPALEHSYKQQPEVL
jgi:hypothetical protein